MSDVPDEDAVADAMWAVLESIVGYYELKDYPLPERRYIAMNSVAHDCEQLTVAFQQLYVGPPGNQLEEPMKCESPRSIVLQIQLVRCVPVVQVRGTAPTAEQITDSTLQMARDSWMILEGAMLAPPVVNWLGAIADVAVTEPSGGFQAVQLNMVLSVP